MVEKDKIRAWQEATVKLYGMPFERHVETYREIMGMSEGPVWFPTEVLARKTRLCAFLRNLGWVGDEPTLEELQEAYRRLGRWSITHRAEFWEKVIQELGIRWQEPYHRVLEGQPRQPRWFVGGKLNVAENLLPPLDTLALLEQNEGGQVRQWSYRELRDAILEVAAGMKALGIQPGDAVALCMPLRAEAVLIFLAILYVGAIFVGIPDSLAAPEVKVRLKIARPKLLFTQDVIFREGKKIPLYERFSGIDLPKTVVIAGGDQVQARLRNNALTWQNFLREGDRGVGLLPVYVEAMDPIGILFSSGTTAEPKAIVWHGHTAFKCGMDGRFYQDIQPGMRVSWPTNMGWMMGPWLIFATLMNRGTVCLYDGAPTGRGFCEFIASQKVQVVGTVPSLVRRWLEGRAWENLDWRHIHCFSSTGEASEPYAMWQLMAAAGYRPVIEYCGGTEIGGGYITSTLLHPNTPSVFSTASLGWDFVLVDEEGKSAQEGELFLVPPSVGMSSVLLNASHEKVYYEGVPAVCEEWEGAWGLSMGAQGASLLRRHGDVMRKLGHGWQAGGRADDAMNIGGIKVSSAEIERVIFQLEGVEDVAAVGIAPAQGGPEELIVFLVPQREYVLSAEAWQQKVQKVIKEKLNPLFHVARVELREALPRTASNKVLRRLLRQQLRGA
ncbi:MAG: AMP-binding protein [Bacteroidia bacterium]